MPIRLAILITRKRRMKQNGIVQSSGDGRAVVVLTGAEGCATCSSKGSCGIMCGGSRRPHEVSVLNPVGAVRGDLVELELPPRKALTAIFLLFILPVIGLVAALLSTPRSWTQSLRAVMVLAGMAAGLLAGTTLAGRFARSSDMDLTITAILGRAGCSLGDGACPPEKGSGST